MATSGSSRLLWTIFDSILDRTQDSNVCHAMAAKMSGNDNNEDNFSIISTATSEDPTSYHDRSYHYEVCSVDSFTEKEKSSSSHRHHSDDDYSSEPSNSLLLEEEIDEGRAAAVKQQQYYATSILSNSASTATTETNSSSRTRTISHCHNDKTTRATPSSAQSSSVIVDIDEFQFQKDQRDKDEQRQRRQKRDRIARQDKEDTTSSSTRSKNQHGPLQRKASEETEDSDIDDSLVFDDDYVAEFDTDETTMEPEDDHILVYDHDDDEDLVMVVDDDDIDDDEMLTRLIDIHVGDMMDGSAHMEKISMRLRSNFEYSPSPLASSSTNNTLLQQQQQQQVPNSTPMMMMMPPAYNNNYSMSCSSRRRQQLLSLPQIVEQEAEGDHPEPGSQRQACLEEIEDPHLRTLLKTISRRSKCSERFDMDALMEHLETEDVIMEFEPPIHSALENLSSRIIRKANPSNGGSEIEEMDLDLFFDDIRKGVSAGQEFSSATRHIKHDAPSTTTTTAEPKRRKRSTPEVTTTQEERENTSPPPADLLLLKIADDIVLDCGMSALTMGTKACSTSTTTGIDDSLILASLNMNLASCTSNNENKPQQHLPHFFGRSNKNHHKHKTTPKKNDTTAEQNSTTPQQQQPFSTLNNKTSLSSRLGLKKKLLTRGSTKMSQKVGKLFKTPTTSTTENYSSDTPTTSVTLGPSPIGSSSDFVNHEAAAIALSSAADVEEERVPELSSSRTKIMSKKTVVGKLLSMTPTTTTTTTISNTEYSSTTTTTTATNLPSPPSKEEDREDPPSSDFMDDENRVPEKISSSSRKSRMMAKLWQKTKQVGAGSTNTIITTITAGGRKDTSTTSYQTLDPIGERASA